MIGFSLAKQFADYGVDRDIYRQAANFALIKMRNYTDQPTGYAARAHQVTPDAGIVSANHIGKLALTAMGTKQVNYCGA